MTHGRKPRTPRPVHQHSWLNAIHRAARLSALDVMQQTAIIRHALTEFACGRDCARHWLSLADTANVAETLCEMGIGSGPAAEDVIERAQQALVDVHGRQAERGSWTLYADEIDALGWLRDLHVLQLDVASYGEFDQAMTRTHNRMAQALAGNAAPGTVVLTGQIGQPTAGVDA